MGVRAGGETHGRERLRGRFVRIERSRGRRPARRCAASRPVPEARAARRQRRGILSGALPRHPRRLQGSGRGRNRVRHERAGGGRGAWCHDRAGARAPRGARAPPRSSALRRDPGALLLGGAGGVRGRAVRDLQPRLRARLRPSGGGRTGGGASHRCEALPRDMAWGDGRGLPRGGDHSRAEDRAAGAEAGAGHEIRPPTSRASREQTQPAGLWSTTSRPCGCSTGSPSTRTVSTATR